MKKLFALLVFMGFLFIAQAQQGGGDPAAQDGVQGQAVQGVIGEALLRAHAGGVVGSLADSVLGASLQVRRWCDRCDSATEQPVHVCGTATRAVGGLPSIDNDTVNLLSVAIGGLTALLVAVLVFRPA